jgi:hypothetical protein
VVKRRKTGLVCALPWQTNSIFVKCDQPPEKPYSAAVYRDFHKGRLRCAGQKKLLVFCDSVTEKAKYGKMRQVNAVNGSQMVVKIGGSYYRRKQEHKVLNRQLPDCCFLK